jgi:hypothetical protein
MKKFPSVSCTLKSWSLISLTTSPTFKTGKMASCSCYFQKISRCSHPNFFQKQGGIKEERKKSDTDDRRKKSKKDNKMKKNMTLKVKNSGQKSFIRTIYRRKEASDLLIS